MPGFGAASRLSTGSVIRPTLAAPARCSAVINTGLPRAGQDGTRVTIFSLADQAEKIVRARPEIPIYVRADQAIPYGDVVAVMTVLQRAGAPSVGLMTDPVENLDATPTPEGTS